MTEERIILGIDPGTNIMGYGIISVKQNKIELIVCDVLKLNNLDNQALKLKKIFETTLKLVEIYQPDELSIEAPFFGKNVQSMLKLGRAQGVAIAAALYRNIPIFEYLPKKIKQSITGNGNASKEQVAKMLYSILKMKEETKYYDATDGLAAAVCHFFQHKNRTTEYNKYSNWASFIKNNPNRIL